MFDVFGFDAFSVRPIATGVPAAPWRQVIGRQPAGKGG